MRKSSPAFLASVQIKLELLAMLARSAFMEPDSSMTQMKSTLLLPLPTAILSQLAAAVLPATASPVAPARSRETMPVTLDRSASPLASVTAPMWITRPSLRSTVEKRRTKLVSGTPKMLGSPLMVMLVLLINASTTLLRTVLTSLVEAVVMVKVVLATMSKPSWLLPPAPLAVLVTLP